MWVDWPALSKSLETDQLTTAFKLGEEWYRRGVSESDDHPFDKRGIVPTIGDLFVSYAGSLHKATRTGVDER